MTHYPNFSLWRRRCVTGVGEGRPFPSGSGLSKEAVAGYSPTLNANSAEVGNEWRHETPKLQVFLLPRDVSSPKFFKSQLPFKTLSEGGLRLRCCWLTVGSWQAHLRLKPPLYTDHYNVKSVRAAKGAASE